MLNLVSRTSYSKRATMHITKVYRPVFMLFDIEKDKQ